jgi:hypothetical protein
MMELAFSAISIFPLSFVMFALSERMIARHESRVGKHITVAGYLWQTWVDTRVDLRGLGVREWALFLFQLSIVFLYGIDAEYLIFPYLAANGFLLAMLSPSHGNVLKKISSDREQVAFSAAGAMAALCLLGAFTLSGTANLSAIQFHFGHLLFVIPFQLAGMILFGEHPFSGFQEKRTWIESARFYAWSMVTARVFLGDGSFFFDFHLKAALLYFSFRLVGAYFPAFRQKDFLRILVLYGFPLTGILWLIAMMAHAWFDGGALGV